MAYLECYIMPVRSSERALYNSIVAQSAAIYRELGALSVTDCWGDNTPVGELTSFPRSVDLQPGETVVLSMLTFRDRAHRDEVTQRIENDMRLVDLFMQTPLDGRRMIMGGFDVALQA
jgi:uncharacterized protein YbaA (DUF1428 family)